ncbi:MAG: transglutaminase domain-containing protein [Firmicutes bacterium]|nr:transglutaminase domain-containing protein [Bacillota bacterium]
MSADVGDKTGGFARISRGGAPMDALACLLLSAGAMTALLAPTELDHSVWACLLAAAVPLVFYILPGRRWWIMPSALAGLALLSLLYQRWTGVLPDTLAYWRAFARWVTSGAPYVEDVTDPGFMTAAYGCVAVSVTLVIYVLIRRLFFFPVFVLIQAAALTASYLIMDSDLTKALCLSAAGLIVLLPKTYANRLIKQSGVPVGEAERAGVSKSRMQAVAAAAAAVSVLLALLTVPADTSKWKSDRLNSFADDLNTKFGVSPGGWGWDYSDFSLDELGFEDETGDLGGPAGLNDMTYLSVWTDRPVLLKGRVLDYYDGNGWSVSSPDADMRLGGVIWRGARAEAFDLDKPIGGAEAKSLYDELTSDVEVTVRYARSSGNNTLFAPANIREFTPGAYLKNEDAYFNARSELFLRRNVYNGEQYTVSARVWDTGKAGFDEKFAGLEKLVKDPKGYAAAKERYTQLPDELPASVRQTAEFIVHITGFASPYLKARAISKWLSENASYTLTPDTPPEGADFTAHFLETKEGYCVYFATAMTVLARCAGLPARYVEGFALEGTEKRGLYQATGRTGHAWSEVYFEGIGWLTFDPLNWNPAAPLNGDAPVAAPVIPAPAAETPPPTPSPPPQDRGVIAPPAVQGTRNRALFIWPPILAAAALFGLFRWALWAGPRHKARMWAYDGVRRRFAGTSRQLDALYNDTLRLLAFHGLSVSPGETLVTFPERADKSVTIDGRALAETAGALMRTHFGEILPGEEEIRRACEYHGVLESMTLENLGKVRYLFRRALIP